MQYINYPMHSSVDQDQQQQHNVILEAHCYPPLPLNLSLITETEVSTHTVLFQTTRGTLRFVTMQQSRVYNAYKASIVLEGALLILGNRLWAYV